MLDRSASPPKDVPLFEARARATFHSPQSFDKAEDSPYLISWKKHKGTTRVEGDLSFSGCEPGNDFALFARAHKQFRLRPSVAKSILSPVLLDTPAAAKLCKNISRKSSWQSVGHPTGPSLGWRLLSSEANGKPPSFLFGFCVYLWEGGGPGAP